LGCWAGPRTSQGYGYVRGGHSSASWSLYNSSPPPPDRLLPILYPPPPSNNVDQDGSGLSHIPAFSFCWQACSSGPKAAGNPEGDVPPRRPDPGRLVSNWSRRVGIPNPALALWPRPCHLVFAPWALGSGIWDLFSGARFKEAKPGPSSQPGPSAAMKASSQTCRKPRYRRGGRAAGGRRPARAGGMSPTRPGSRHQVPGREATGPANGERNHPGYRPRGARSREFCAYRPQQYLPRDSRPEPGGKVPPFFAGRRCPRKGARVLSVFQQRPQNQ